MKRLDQAARRGRLPGFRAGAEPTLFVVAAHGHPFDGELLAEYKAGAGGGRGELAFRLAMLRKLPAVFVVVLAATIWPGVYFMDQLIPGEWGWIPTWWWYLPVTVLPLPWMWRGMMRKSRASMDAAAREAIAKIAAEVGGEVACGAGADGALAAGAAQATPR